MYVRERYLCAGMLVCSPSGSSRLSHIAIGAGLSARRGAHIPGLRGLTIPGFRRLSARALALSIFLRSEPTSAFLLAQHHYLSALSSALNVSATISESSSWTYLRLAIKERSVSRFSLASVVIIPTSPP